MLRKSIITFVFAVCASAAFADDAPPVSKEMQCIARCVRNNGWEMVQLCVDLCTPEN